MITVKNVTSGETKKVYNVEVAPSGAIVPNDGKKRGARFVALNADVLTLTNNEPQEFALRDEWTVVTKGTRRNATKATTDEPTPTDEPKPTKAKRTKKAKAQASANGVTTTNDTTTPAEPVVVEPIVNDEPTTTTATDEPTTVLSNEDVALLLALKRVKGGNVDEERCEEIFKALLEKYATDEPKKVAKAAKRIATAKAKGAKVYHCKDYDDIKKDVEDGFYPYLVGAAGCGKSHTAEQIAEDLGLELYCQTTIQFAHDVKGYGTADGRLVETPFYKAFAFGGLYFQDEYDRSFTEAAVVLNTAVANLYYDFPVVGRVYAHPNFRFMAAGNTRMKGADSQYTAAQPIDISSVDRVVFYECEYSHEVELNAIAGGDVELVAFVEDARKAIAETGVEHVLSYRATKYMKARENNKEAALLRATFKALEKDEIRIIYGALKNKSNVWAKAMKNII